MSLASVDQTEVFPRNQIISYNVGCDFESVPQNQANEQNICI